LFETFMNCISSVICDLRATRKNLKPHPTKKKLRIKIQLKWFQGLELLNILTQSLQVYIRDLITIIKSQLDWFKGADLLEIFSQSLHTLICNVYTIGEEQNYWFYWRKFLKLFTETFDSSIWDIFTAITKLKTFSS